MSNISIKSQYPCDKFNNEHFRNFLEKNIRVDIPDESTLRKNYDEQCYSDTIKKLKITLEIKQFW